MSLFRAIRTIIMGPPEMATVRLSSWIMIDISALYKIQHTAEDRGFLGWLMVSKQHRLEAEFEGPRSELEKFVDSIANGKLTGRELPIERAWTQFYNRYQRLRLRLPEMVVHTSHRSRMDE